ncbi:MAG: universal stress protein [Archangium sp.]|nr:universal stress protein [Archangium sp.]
MSHVTHRLKGAIEGALAGGGDPATSPLYVFGPYLRLLAASGVGAVCFGAPLWMVVATVVVVSLMYRNVMRWIPDGSGGSGLCEEEFGGWAVKTNASITAIEYTLTFLVSIAALVTFIADRVGGLERPARTGLALFLSVLVGLVVNRGPRLAARVFGPATAAVLLLLWVLVGAVIVKRGLHLPSFELAAFSAANLHVTLGGYVRLLALMTGIEVFANLVAAYDGAPAARSRKAFGSLLIVMTTTLVTMVVVGPAIYALADPSNAEVSVFTQTMDALLPGPVAYAGTLVGIVVLLSAAAASAQGLQNLALGLRHRHYVPAVFGQRNRFDVADRPVYAQVAVVVACFLAFGTHEETYLALYAAGVFVLLGLTGWAAVKRLGREARQKRGSLVSLVATVLAALVTSGAAGLIFFERFAEGAWTYALLVPALYLGFSRFRARLGPPSRVEERLGRVLLENKSFVLRQPSAWPRTVLAIVDGSQESEPAILSAASTGAMLGASVGVAAVGVADAETYLGALRALLGFEGAAPALGSTAEVNAAAREAGADLLTVTREFGGLKELLATAELPVLLTSGRRPAARRYPALTCVVVGLDGSRESEATLPFVVKLQAQGARVVLVLVPDGELTAATLQPYGEQLRAGLASGGPVSVVVGGSGPARTLIEQAAEVTADLVLVARHGGGGVHRAADVHLGSVPARLISELECPLLLVPALADEARVVGPEAGAEVQLEERPWKN